MKRFALSLFVVMSAVSLLACNTVSGLGKDIEKGGQAIGRAVK